MTKAVLKELWKSGLRGARARVTVERLASNAEVVRCQWWEGGRKLVRSWPNTAENRRVAKAYAEGTVERLQRAGVTVLTRYTAHELVERYFLSKRPEWRPATITNTANKWKALWLYLAPSTHADLVTPETLDEIRDRMRKDQRAASQIAGHMTQIKAVWAFALERKLLTENRIASYKVRLGKDDRPMDIGEYTPAEATAILGALSYRSSRTWRPWAAITLAAVLGCRENALLNLRLPDIDLKARTVTWRAELDKLGRLRVQPLPRAAVYAFRIMAVWRRRMQYAGAWAFPPVQLRRGDRPWTAQSLTKALHDAEDRAGVDPMPYRAMHGLRRMAAKNILVLTGDLNAVGEWIGDRDLRVLKESYLKERPDELRALARRVDFAISKPSKRPNGDRSPKSRTPSPVTD